MAALLAVSIWLALPAAQAGHVQAQESEATPAPEQRPGRGSGDGSGRRPGGQPGNRGDGETRPGQPNDEQPDAPPAAGPAADGSAGQMPTVADTERTETGGAEPNPAIDLSSSIVAVAGIDGAVLTDRPFGSTLFTVPMGTVMQAAGRTEDGKWLYVVRAAVIKGGEELEPSVAGWTSEADVFAFSIENLPILDAEAPPIILPDPDLGETSQLENPQLDHGNGEEPGMSFDEDTESYTDSDIEPNSEQNAAPHDTEGEGPIATTGVVNLVGSRLNLRAAPDTTAAIMGKLQPQQSVDVLGRSESAEWLLVSDGVAFESVGWASADFIDIDVDLATVRVESVRVESVRVESVRVESVPVESVSVAYVQSGTSDAVLTTPELTEMPTASPAIAGVASSGWGDLIVVQTSPGATFYAYNLTSGAFWPLTRGFDPAISSDGKTVAFTRDGGENGIYLIDIDSTDERLIFAERGRLASPKWSPNGDWIAFSRGNTYAECYQIGRTCLTASQIRARNPNVDLSQFDLVKEPRYHLAMVDANGDNYTDIAALDTARAPDWIEAGIVYQSSAGLQLTDTSPDAENRLVIDDYLKPYFHDPDWQPGQGPGGGRIAYMGKEGSHWEIFTVNPDGSGVTALTRPSTTLKGELPSNVAPAWSPDGSKIVFLSNRADSGGSDIWRLWIMDTDGSNQRPLDIDLELDYTFGDEQAVGW